MWTTRKCGTNQRVKIDKKNDYLDADRPGGNDECSCFNVPNKMAELKGKLHQMAN